MSAWEEGREAAQRLLRTDPLSKESVDMIANAVMDAFAPGYAHELAEKLRASAAGTRIAVDRAGLRHAADLIDPEVE